VGLSPLIPRFFCAYQSCCHHDNPDLVG
jgi:hypothetical protein